MLRGLTGLLCRRKRTELSYSFAKLHRAFVASLHVCRYNGLLRSQNVVDILAMRTPSLTLSETYAQQLSAFAPCCGAVRNLLVYQPTAAIPPSSFPLAAATAGSHNDVGETLRYESTLPPLRPSLSAPSPCLSPYLVNVAAAFNRMATGGGASKGRCRRAAFAIVCVDLQPGHDPPLSGASSER